MTPPEAGPDQRLLIAFRRAAAHMPWYRTLLDEHGVQPGQIVDAASFSRLAPVLTKRNTFDRFALAELAATTSIPDLAGVLTSSGHGGRFSFGLQTRAQAAAGGQTIDWALDEAFQVKSRSTLAVNCLPMGVGFSSERMTVATTSVREDMAVALVQAFGGSYEQILLVADPLFMKRLLDHAAAAGVDWRRYRVQVVLGEETFGERFRDYVSTCLGLETEHPERGYVASSFGVGELGLHLCFETPATIGVRRAAAADLGLARELLGVENDRRAIPMVFTYNPERTFIEIEEPDRAGYGRLTISMLDPELPVPLLRYQTGDIVRLLDAAAAAAVLESRGGPIAPALPVRLLALEGRDRERLPDGSHVSVYKDALYADHRVAGQVTGAVRVCASGGLSTVHVQLAPSGRCVDGLEQRLLDVLPAALASTRVVFWPYQRFPYGMTLDYERKFTYYVAGESEIAPDLPPGFNPGIVLTAFAPGSTRRCERPAGYSVYSL